MPLGAAASRSLSVKIAHMVGPGMQGGWAFNESGMVAIVGAVMMHASEAEVEALVALLADSTQIDVVAGSGKRVLLQSVMELHFAGAMDEQMQWLAFALMVHLGPLVAWLKSLMDAAAMKAT